MIRSHSGETAYFLPMLPRPWNVTTIPLPDIRREELSHCLPAGHELMLRDRDLPVLHGRTFGFAWDEQGVYVVPLATSDFGDEVIRYTSFQLGSEHDPDVKLFRFCAAFFSLRHAAAASTLESFEPATLLLLNAPPPTLFCATPSLSLYGRFFEDAFRKQNSINCLSSMNLSAETRLRGGECLEQKPL